MITKCRCHDLRSTRKRVCRRVSLRCTLPRGLTSLRKREDAKTSRNLRREKKKADSTPPVRRIFEWRSICRNLVMTFLRRCQAHQRVAAYVSHRRAQYPESLCDATHLRCHPPFCNMENREATELSPAQKPLWLTPVTTAQGANSPTHTRSGCRTLHAVSLPK